MLELFLTLVVIRPTPERRGRERSQQSKMVKSLSALVIFALLGAWVIALAAFAPEVEARETAAMAKGDRLQVRTDTLNCSTQVWPNFAASCLRNAGSGAKILEARFVTTRS